MEMSYQQYNDVVRSIKDPMRRKSFVNSYYPIVGNREFSFYDHNKAETVKETASATLRELITVC